MRRTFLVALCAWIGLGGVASAQPPADCRPNALNIPGAPYPCLLPDNRVMFRVAAPEALNDARSYGVLPDLIALGGAVASGDAEAATRAALSLGSKLDADAFGGLYAKLHALQFSEMAA